MINIVFFAIKYGIMIIYFAATLADIILYVIMFAVMYRSGQQHLTFMQSALLGAALNFSYVPASFIAGIVLTDKNCKKLLTASGTGILIIGIAVILSPSFIKTFILLFLIGACAAFFFNSFQAYMRTFPDSKEMSHAVALYTLFWSSGVSLGFVFSGFFYSMGIWWLAAVISICGTTALLIIGIYKPAPARNIQQAATPRPGSSSITEHSKYVFIGWIIVFLVTFVQRAIQTFFPVICATENISAYLTGIPLFLMMLFTALTGYWMKNLQKLFYAKPLILLMNLAAIIMLLLIWLIPNYFIYIIGFSVMGIYGGFGYFSSVFYSNNDYANKSRNVGINELMVGVASILGIFICEFAIRLTGNTKSIYLLCSIILILSTIYIIIKLSKQTKSVKQ